MEVYITSHLFANVLAANVLAAISQLTYISENNNILVLIQDVQYAYVLNLLWSPFATRLCRVNEKWLALCSHT